MIQLNCLVESEESAVDKPLSTDDASNLWLSLLDSPTHSVEDREVSLDIYKY